MAGPEDKRRRNLAVLGGATFAVVALAGLALFQEGRNLTPEFRPQPVFPGLTERVNNLGEVIVETKDGSFHARRMEGGIWVLPEKYGFHASVASVRAAAMGLAELEALEQRTAQPEFFARLGLTAPAEGGEATRIALLDRDGAVMADLLAGNAEGTADPLGRNRLYVRRAGENQTYLARGSLVAQPNIGDWLDKRVLDLERDQIQSATIAPPGGPRYTVSRASADEPNFALQDMPAGRELNYPGAANTAAAALVNFTFDDVRPAAEVDFAGAGTAETRTFDGVTITVRIIEADGAHWANITAAGEGAAGEAAAAINANAEGWAFKLAQYDAETLMTARDSLLRPSGG